MSGKLGKIGEFVRFLAEKGDWCSLTEVAEAIRLSEDKVEKVARLFAESNFAEFNEKTKKVKLGADLRELYAK